MKTAEKDQFSNEALEEDHNGMMTIHLLRVADQEQFGEQVMNLKHSYLK